MAFRRKLDFFVAGFIKKRSSDAAARRFDHVAR